VESSRTFAPVTVTLRDRRAVRVRSIRPDDEQRLQSAVRGLSEESRYTRFMGALRELPPRLLERAVNPERGRELQLVAVVEAGGEETIVAGTRYAAEPGSDDCEFAIALGDGWRGTGLARRLLELLIAAARADGFTHMDGLILASNTRMLGLATKLGFVPVRSDEGPTVRKVRLRLRD
jgi:GNAT superfamily N-acetyltransferase